ncbi:MAG: metallophosphoesterase [Candidatus Syntrophosphaera sp.]|nr:metallophosphoesterase [Candidatus Syntrophosphaera sp.]
MKIFLIKPSIRDARRKLLLLLALFFFSWLCPSLSADIAVYGDTQTNAKVHARIVSSVLGHEPEVVFHLGDLTSRGSQQRHYDAFFAIEDPLVHICPLWPARGNHDRSRDLFLDNFPALDGKTWYTVEHDSLLFIILDSNLDLKPRSDQYNWLRQTLEAGPPLPRIVLLHYPVFSSGYKPGEAELDLFLPALFESYGVVAVFSGHHHNYERLEHAGITYVISGGAGGNLLTKHKLIQQSRMLRVDHHYMILSRDGSSLNCAAYGLDGQVFETFAIPLP